MPVALRGAPRLRIWRMGQHGLSGGAAGVGPGYTGSAAAAAAARWRRDRQRQSSPVCDGDDMGWRWTRRGGVGPRFVTRGRYSQSRQTAVVSVDSSDTQWWVAAGLHSTVLTYVCGVLAQCVRGASAAYSQRYIACRRGEFRQTGHDRRRSWSWIRRLWRWKRRGSRSALLLRKAAAPGVASAQRRVSFGQASGREWVAAQVAR